jgi:hypothetical protein
MSDIQQIPFTSEEEWLEERRIRVTATDVARLAHGGPATWAAVKAEKHGARGFGGNRYTEWGHEREPIILDHLRFLFDVEPNKALFVNGRWAATPDATSEQRNGEIKTTVKPWDDLQDLRASNPGYYDQSQWAMLVRDVGECAFGFEPHENFQPQPVRAFLIPRDDTRIAELMEIAERFALFVEDEDPEPGEFDDLIALYAEREHALKEAQAAVDEVKRLVRERAGDRRELSAKSPFGSVSLFTPKPSARFDTASFKKEHPDLAAEYTKPGTAQAEPTLRITPIGEAA